MEGGRGEGGGRKKRGRRERWLQIEVRNWGEEEGGEGEEKRETRV